MDEIENRYQLLCDRVSNILRNDRAFAKKWGVLFRTFGEIDNSWADDYTDLDTYGKVCEAIQADEGGRFDPVREAFGRACALIDASRELMTGRDLAFRLAEIRLRLVIQTLNACFPAAGDGAFVWAPAFEYIETPCVTEDGRDYEFCVRRGNGEWMCPVAGSEEESEFKSRGYFTLNSKDKATFVAERFAPLFRDWLDNYTGLRPIEL